MKGSLVLRTLGQSFLVVFIISVVFIIFRIELGEVFIASIASSTFAMFTIPHSLTAHTRNIIGGYAVGIVLGYVFFCLANTTLIQADILSNQILSEIWVALAVGSSVFFMSWLKVIHPPAVGMTVGILFSPWTYASILITFGLIISMLLMRRLFRRFIIDLEVLHT